MSSVFRFKHFDIYQENASLKVGTDAMVLGAFCSFPEAKTALDVGTGTGVISLMVAQTHPNLLIDAIDIDQHNIDLAKYNIEKSPFSSRINLMHQDIFTFNPNKKYDLIFSNPPFHLDSLKNNEVRTSKAKHFSELEINTFIKKLSSLLSEKGKLVVIFPSESLSDLDKYLVEYKLVINEIISVYGKPSLKKRVIIFCSNNKTMIAQKDFIIRNSDGNYSKEYIDKTKEFHYTDLERTQKTTNF